MTNVSKARGNFLQGQLEPRRRRRVAAYWPVIDWGTRGAVGVATQVAGASYVDVEEADTYTLVDRC